MVSTLPHFSTPTFFGEFHFLECRRQPARQQDFGTGGGHESSTLQKCQHAQRTAGALLNLQRRCDDHGTGGRQLIEIP